MGGRRCQYVRGVERPWKVRLLWLRGDRSKRSPRPSTRSVIFQGAAGEISVVWENAWLDSTAQLQHENGSTALYDKNYIQYTVTVQYLSERAGITRKILHASPPKGKRDFPSHENERLQRPLGLVGFCSTEGLEVRPDKNRTARVLVRTVRPPCTNIAISPAVRAW